MARNKNLVMWIVVVAAVLGAIALIVAPSYLPSELNDFAKCLGEKNAVFYGAYWCPHCQNQKAMFGSAEKYLPYIECSTPDGRSQLPVCEEKKINGYPTWEFADGSRLSGEVRLETLREKTGCSLPSGDEAALKSQVQEEGVSSSVEQNTGEQTAN